MKYGGTDGKKIILHANIAGNSNQDQLWAILNTVDSNFEEDTTVWWSIVIQSSKQSLMMQLH